MRRIVNCLPAVFATLSLATAAGAALAAPNVVEVTTAPLRGVYPAEADAVQGWYRMSDGRQLQLVRSGARVAARLDGEPEARLMAQSNGVLRDAEGRMVLSFDAAAGDGDGGVTLVITRPDGQKVAMAARR